MRIPLTITLAATAALLVPQPAQAVPVPVDGYVWGNQPGSPDYFVATGYEHNSSGGAIRITRLGVGSYKVRFYGMAGAGGVAHASAYGGAFHCPVVSYGPSGADQLVYVRCYTPDAMPVDSRFVASFTNRPAAGSFGYLWSDDATPPPGGHVPAAAWSYDSTGQQIVVYQPAVGVYQVELGAYRQDTPNLWASGVLRVTAYGAAARECQVWDPEFAIDPTMIEVHCYDDNGLAVDTRFTLTYARKVTMLGLPDPRASATLDTFTPAFEGWTNTAGGAPTFSIIDDGSYQIDFPNAGVPKGHAMATTLGTPPMFCIIESWWSTPGWEHLWITCHDGDNGDLNPVGLFNVGFIA
jgi:hypothetical protein